MTTFDWLEITCVHESLQLLVHWPAWTLSRDRNDINALNRSDLCTHVGPLLGNDTHAVTIEYKIMLIPTSHAFTPFLDPKYTQTCMMHYL